MIYCALNTSSIALADVSFLGVAAGDPSSTEVNVWTRAVDESAPSATTLSLHLSTDPGFVSFVTLSGTTDPAKDYTLKLDLAGLNPSTEYFYRFVSPGGATSIVGRFKTAPASGASVPVKFGFSGDMDGLMRPYALASTIPANRLDFFVNLGDVIYENASNVKGNIGASYLNSPSVTLSGQIPSPSNATTFANEQQIFTDYSKKYREQFLPVNVNGQKGLQPFYAAQANYTLNDNHELGNRQYINGGAPTGGPVGGMASGAGVDARTGEFDVNATGTFMNKAPGFLGMLNVYLNYQPIANRGAVNVPLDPRTDGTRQLYFAQPWGKNALFINTDCRSYRDIRMKTSANADDTGSRADNPSRTMLGATQFAWLKKNLLDAQNSGVIWKFIAVSDPIDQLGPIGGALALANLPSFGVGSTYSPVSADGGKSWQGGYRAERNALLKFIADNHILNVVFLSTDDHQNRVNELTYSPTGQTAVQSTYVKVPACFEITAGPLGATGPDLIKEHTFAMAKQLVQSLVDAQQLAGIEPLGLQGYPGLKNVVREEDPDAGATPTAVDFYSPDTFNYSLLEVSPDGGTLTVSSIGMTATAQNSATEYANGPQAREVFRFQIDADYVPAGVKVTRGGYVYNRRTQKFAQQVRVSNTGTTTISSPVMLALDGLTSGVSLVGSAGTTASLAPVGSPYVLVPVGGGQAFTPGKTLTLTLEFQNPSMGGINYTPRVIVGPLAP